MVLGGGLRADGSAHPATLSRANGAATVALAEPDLAVICSGRGGAWDDPVPAVSEARWMRDVIVGRGVAPEHVVEEDESRDTIGNALLVRVRYLEGLPPRPLLVVTSPSHIERSLYVFRSVMGPSWPCEARTSELGEWDRRRWPREPELMRNTEELFRGLRPGELDAIVERVRERNAYYRGLRSLDPARRCGSPRSRT